MPVGCQQSPLDPPQTIPPSYIYLLTPRACLFSRFFLSKHSNNLTKSFEHQAKTVNMDKQCLEFSGLPKELRLLIWDATMEPKFLRIGIGKGNRTTADTWSPYGNPVALRVCVESRKRALERYTLPIGINRYHKDLPTGLAAAKRYIDPERDVLFCTCN